MSGYEASRRALAEAVVAQGEGHDVTGYFEGIVRFCGKLCEEEVDKLRVASVRLVAGTTVADVDAALR